MRWGCRIQRAFPAAPVPWSQLALGADTDTTDRHAHTAHGPESLYKHTLGPAAARASHFLLHVVVELEFGLIGQLHGPVLQLPGKGERCYCYPADSGRERILSGRSQRGSLDKGME